ncbi:MAG: hypothetical protein AB1679_03085 [Actinomycetota bacterium]|jgi:hypothetical protein
MKILHLLRNQWDRAAAVALLAGGGLALLLGWLGVSSTVFTFRQIPFLISGGLVGVCLIVVAAAVWVSADLRDEWRKLDELQDTLREIDLRAVTPAEAVADSPAGPGDEALARRGPRLRVSEG